MLGLDSFWEGRLAPSRKGTDWLAILKAIVMYRLADPGSELAMHGSWLADTAIPELVGPGALTTLYSCLDRVMRPSAEWKKPRGGRKGSFKDELFHFLRDRWAGLFGSTCDVVLFGLTSTYFEVVQQPTWPTGIGPENLLQRFCGVCPHLVHFHVCLYSLNKSSSVTSDEMLSE